MEKKTTIRERGTAPAGLVLSGDTIIPGGYYDAENNLLSPMHADTKKGPREYYAQQKKLNEQFAQRIQEPDVFFLRGKRLLVLDYAYEPDDSVNFAYHHAGKKGIFYVQSIINRILRCAFCYDYYKITCNYPGVISRLDFQSIVDRVKPDYVWIIGFDLFNRLPTIVGKGPSLVTKNGHANTFYIEGASETGKVLCLPMPHPKTPGFDSEVERIWHEVIVELLKH